MAATKIRIIGNLDGAVEWAFHHEVDRLWAVNYTGQAIMPNIRTMHYRTLDDAIKATAEMCGCHTVWFRREHNNNYEEPFLSCRSHTANESNIVAYLEPIALAFAMPARKPDWLTVEAEKSLDIKFSSVDQLGLDISRIGVDKVAEWNGIDLSQYSHLDNGRRRMVVGNILRSRKRNGGTVWLESPVPGWDKVEGGARTAEEWAKTVERANLMDSD